MILTRILVLALAFTLFGAVQAEAPERASVESFLTYMNDLRAGFKEAKPKPLSAREWELFDAADKDIRAVLDGKDSIDGLSRRERERLINAQERVTAILTGAEDDRLICRRERTVGTHFQRTTCVTVAERRREREESQQALNRMPPPPPPITGGG
jgi:hypothetical protein